MAPCKCERVLPFPFVTVRTLREWITNKSYFESGIVVTIATQIGQRSKLPKPECVPPVIVCIKLGRSRSRPLRCGSYQPHKIMFGCRGSTSQDDREVWVCMRAGWAVPAGSRNNVRVAGVATYVAAGVAAAAHRAYCARGVQRARGGGAGAAPLARQAPARQAPQGSPLLRGPHRRHQCRARALLAHGRAQSVSAAAPVQITRPTRWS